MQNRAWTPSSPGAQPGLSATPEQVWWVGDAWGLAPAPLQTYSVTPVTRAGPNPSEPWLPHLCRMGSSPTLPTKELIGTCFESKVRNVSENQGGGRIADCSQTALNSSCCATV